MSLKATLRENCEISTAFVDCSQRATQKTTKEKELHEWRKPAVTLTAGTSERLP